MLTSVDIDESTYDITKESEKTEDGTEHKSILLKDGDQEFRLSPNTTDAELASYADPCQEGHSI